ncbi:MAG: hypothetical protein EFKGCFLK_00003 [Rhodocyclaceae bacterium]|nr:MAG: SPOR domain-containing protein [Rhodocyclaceae bacterium]MBE7423669.1 SPOR domain-containing protein [Zoogloeaceae bacterium]MBV6406458.1 hypothetical protein [Rhodocyclaceae bacterium]MCK6385399.1 SPOR domain-containing protein [Rhodocyclaceae bacterium]CAG0944668.1 hypothetical protein GPROT2_02771 [Gammaproteobacteria bacterium]
MQVLRTVFFLLVLGNLLLFAWGQGYLGATGSGGEGERLAAQLAPDRLQIVGRNVPPDKSAEPVRAACRALAGLAPEAADKLIELLKTGDAQLKALQRPHEEPKSWWVHIPPSPNSAQADKKAAELSRLGVKDFYVVRESGPNRYAISLGLYKSEEGAKAYLNVLAGKNVKSARIHVREAAGDKSVVELRGTPEQLAKALAGLPAEFSDATRADCAPAAP